MKTENSLLLFYFMLFCNYKLAFISWLKIKIGRAKIKILLIIKNPALTWCNHEVTIYLQKLSARFICHFYSKPTFTRVSFNINH